MNTCDRAEFASTSFFLHVHEFLFFFFHCCIYPGSFIFMNIQQQEKATSRQEKPITWDFGKQL